MKRWQRWSLIVLGIVVAIFVLRSTVFRPSPIEVDVVTVESGVVEDAVTNSQAATVKSRLRSRLGAERAGRVIDIPYREGAAVKKGETVVQLDASTARSQLDLARRDLEVAEASRQAAEAAFALAEVEYERISVLRDQGVVSQGELDQARSRFDGAQADLAARRAGKARAEAAVRIAQDDLAHMRVRAPFDGLVAQRLVEVGESVVPGQPVLELVAPHLLYVSARIDEVDIGRLEPGLPARVTLDPFRGEVWHGEVARVFPVVDDRLEQNRTLEVEVDIQTEPDKPEPKPGTSADVVIVIDTRDGVLRVPTFSVIEGRKVLVVENGKAVERVVQTGLRNWEWTEVVDGLAAGDRVITSLDKSGVKNGARVKAIEGEESTGLAGIDR